MWRALSDERTGLPLKIAASAVILESVSRGTRDHILLSQIRDSPTLEGQVLVFIPPRNKVAQLYPHALGSLFVASYDSQAAAAEAYCRQPAGTLNPGTGPRWNPWPYICSMSRPLLCFVIPFVDPPYWQVGVGLLYIYRMVFTYYTLRLRLAGLRQYHLYSLEADP
jgi:hypothetical protein